MIYAGYYNLQQSDKDARKEESRRNSTMSSTDVHAIETKKEKSTFKKLLSQLKATEEDITPSGIYTPIIKRGPLFQGLKPIDQAQTPTPIYQRERPLFRRSVDKKRGSSSSVSSAGSQ